MAVRRSKASALSELCCQWSLGFVGGVGSSDWSSSGGRTFLNIPNRSRLIGDLHAAAAMRDPNEPRHGNGARRFNQGVARRRGGDTWELVQRWSHGYYPMRAFCRQRLGVHGALDLSMAWLLSTQSRGLRRHYETFMHSMHHCCQGALLCSVQHST
jgi:hypothetical protein